MGGTPTEDRVVAVIDRLDVEHGMRRGAAGIMAGPFPERAFDFAPVRRDIAFEHHLGVGGKRQAGDLALDHPHRTPPQPADDVDLEHAIGRLGAAVEERQRVAAEHHHQR
jgi:hypothetical protein